MIDFRGVELNPGDEVAYISPWYRSMELGTVMYLTPHSARIMSCRHDRECNREARMIFRIESEDE